MVALEILRSQGEDLLSALLAGSAPSLNEQGSRALTGAFLRATRPFGRLTPEVAQKVLASIVALPDLASADVERLANALPERYLSERALLALSEHPNLTPEGALELVTRFWGNSRGEAFRPHHYRSSGELAPLTRSQNVTVRAGACLLRIWNGDSLYAFEAALSEVIRSVPLAELVATLAADAARDAPPYPRQTANTIAWDTLDQATLLLQS